MGIYYGKERSDFRAPRNDRQILPVIPKGARSVIVNASLIKCPLIWDNATKLNLTINMRVVLNGNNPQAITFAKYLLDW